MALSLRSCCCRTKNTLRKLNLCVKEKQIHWSALCLQQEPTVNHQDKIVLPQRIKRGPTDVLKALSETTGRDMTAPDFMYADDPYLIPYQSQNKRLYMLAKMSGKHAARHVVENYPQFFSENPAVPDIEVFSNIALGKIKFVNKADTVEGLMERIKAREAVEAYASFQQIDKSEIPLETFNHLIDLLTVNNGKDPERVFTAEEIFIMDENNSKNSRDSEDKENSHGKWRKNGPVTIVFEMMPVKNSWAYTSIIRGMVKFNKHTEAWKLFQEMKDKEMKIDIETYNDILSILYECVDNFWGQAMDLLKYMKQSGIKPNVETFNSILRTLSLHFGEKMKKDTSSRLINEMHSVGIEPSLATWHYLLQCHFPAKGYLNRADIVNVPMGSTELLADIIGHLDGKTFEMRSKDDDKFFSTAMSKLFLYNKNEVLAKKLFNLGLNNEKLLGGTYLRNDFSSFYLQILCAKRKVNIVMEELQKLIPNFYIIKLNFLKPLLKAIEAHGELNYIPELWSLCRYAQLHYYPDVSILFMKVVSQKQHPPELQEKFVAMARECYSIIEGGHTNSRTSVAQIHDLIVELVKIMMHGEEFMLMWEMFEEYSKAAEKGLIFPPEVYLQLGRVCFKESDFDKLKELFTLLSSMGYVKIGSQILEEAKDQMDLRRDQRQMLESLLD